MAARDTMSQLISDVRALTYAGTAEYTLGAVSFFSDEHIQRYLDAHRQDIWDAPMQQMPRRVSGGSVAYYDYQVGAGNLEATNAGTAVFLVRDGLGATLGTATYTVDYQRGAVTFVADTGGSARYVDARSYDLYSAAADLLESWAAREKLSFDAQTEDQRFSRSQKHKQLLTMAAEYRQRAGVTTVLTVRSDLC